MQKSNALVHFHAPDQSFTTLPQRACSTKAPLKPALHSKCKHIMERSAELRRKASESDAVLEVWLAMGGCGHPAINPSADPGLQCKHKRMV